MKRDTGFTLIEIMITVAIIAILAAIAIPNFVRYQNRSRRAEAELTMAGIAKALRAAFADQSEYLAAGPCPATPTGTDKQFCDWFADVGFKKMGFSTDSYVYCSYGCSAAADKISGTCGASCDVDANLEWSQFAFASSGKDIVDSTIFGPTSDFGGGVPDCNPVDNLPVEIQDGQAKKDMVVRCTGNQIY